MAVSVSGLRKDGGVVTAVSWRALGFSLCDLGEVVCLISVPPLRIEGSGAFIPHRGVARINSLSIWEVLKYCVTGTIEVRR